MSIRRSIGGLIRSSKTTLRSYSVAAGADAPRRRVLPWLIGAVGLGAGGWYFWKGDSAGEDNPVKTATEIIKVHYITSIALLMERHSKSLHLKSSCLIKWRTPIILVHTRLSWIWINSWSAISGMYYRHRIYSDNTVLIEGTQQVENRKASWGRAVPVLRIPNVRGGCLFQPAAARG